MIFFAVLKSVRGKGAILKAIVVQLDPSGLVAHGAKLATTEAAAYRLVCWNEAFDSLEALEALKALTHAVAEAAMADPVCIAIRSEAQRRYRFDPFAKDCDPGARAAFDKVMFHWAHPCIGNLVNSPQVRPVDAIEHYAANWDKCEFLDAESKKAAVLLAKQFPRLTRAGRDHARVCRSLTELARAVMGEVTSTPTRRLEKLIALRLCRSDGFLKRQAAMIAEFTKGDVWGSVSATARHADSQYLKYYLPRDAGTHVDFPGLLKWLVDVAPNAREAAPAPTNLLNRCKIAWLRLPPVIRCATLINELRMISLKNGQRAPREDERVSMCIPDFGPSLIKSDGLISSLAYQTAWASDTKHIPHLTGRGLTTGGRFTSKGPDFTWSWNRDEYHDATMTYRVHLCPLWAGASGHTGGGIQFWMMALGKAFPDYGAVVVASSLFTLWRLYYDRRISGAHTLVETLESTCTESVAGRDVIRFRYDPIAPISPPDDGYSLLEAACFGTKGTKALSIDPILLMRVAEAAYVGSSRSQSGLDALVNLERLALADFWMPQWSKELRTTVGTDVTSFTRESFNTKMLGTRQAIQAVTPLGLGSVDDVVLAYLGVPAPPSGSPRSSVTAEQIARYYKEAMMPPTVERWVSELDLRVATPVTTRRDNFRVTMAALHLKEGEATSESNNCMVHTLYQLEHGKGATTDLSAHRKALGWPLETMIENDERIQAIVAAKGWSLQMYTLAETGIVTPAGHFGVAPSGDRSNVRSVLHFGNHYVPLWPG